MKPSAKSQGFENAIIPRGWRATTLGNLVSLQRGHDLTERERKSGEIPVMGSAGQNGFHDTFIVSGPGVVIGRSGSSYGQAHYSKENFWPHNTCLYVTDFHGNYPLFCYYFLKNFDFSQHNTGGAQQSLNRNFIAPLPIIIPPYSEQVVIADALNEIDALIHTLDMQIAKKRAIKDGLMTTIFSQKKRLPGFHQTWRKTKLSELGVTYGGLIGKSKKDFGHGGAKYITFMNVMKNVVVDDSLFESVDVGSTETQNRVTRGDLIFNGSSETPEEVGLCSYVGTDRENLFLNSFCFGFRFHPAIRIEGRYFAHFFRSYEGRELIKSLAQGAIRYNLSKTAMLEKEFFLPELKEQSAIVEMLSDISADVSSTLERLNKTHGIKKGLMQELLTGRTRLI